MSEDTAVKGLLPTNSSALERALDLAFGTFIERVIPPFPELMNPALAPVSFLPYLAADRGVDEWRASAPESEKRATTAASWKSKRQAGTRRALELAVTGLEMSPEVVSWYEQIPQGAPYSFSVMAWIDRAYDDDIDVRLMTRLDAAKSERDQVKLTVGMKVSGVVNVAMAVLTGEIITIYPYQVTDVAAPATIGRVNISVQDRSVISIYPRSYE